MASIGKLAAVEVREINYPLAGSSPTPSC